MLTQLQIPLPLSTPKGKALAVAVIDYGPHWDLLWVTFLQASGECWTFSNKDIRQEKNETLHFGHALNGAHLHNGHYRKESEFHTAEA